LLPKGFFYLKNRVKKLNKKCKNTKNCQNLGNGWKYSKSSIFEPKALLAQVLQRMIIGFKLYRFFFKLNSILKVVKKEFQQQVWGLSIFSFFIKTLLFLRCFKKTKR